MALVMMTSGWRKSACIPSAPGCREPMPMPRLLPALVLSGLVLKDTLSCFSKSICGFWEWI